MLFFKKKTGKMIDMHCHILPAVDDGSQSMEETLEMLSIAARQGIEAMIVTPHFKPRRHNASCETLLQRIKDVQEQARSHGIDIQLFPGNEVLYYEEMDKELESGRIFALNGTNRVLIEFMPTDEYMYIRNALDRIKGIGYVPIIAHIERYECMLKKPERAEELKQLGIEIQINAASAEGLIGRDIQKYVLNLAGKRLIDYVGTDAHDSKRRIPSYNKAYQILAKKADAEYLNEIFYENASAIVNAE